MYHITSAFWDFSMFVNSDERELQKEKYTPVSVGKGERDGRLQEEAL